MGLAAINATLAAGLRPGLGVDVLTTTGGDMFTQMHSAHQVARMMAFQEKVSPPITARDVLGFATIDAARTIGLDSKVGSLKVGKRADLVLLRADRPGLSSLIDPVGAVVSAATVADVDTVIIDGTVRKRYGNLMVAAAVIVVAGIAAWRGYGWWEAKKAAESGAAVVTSQRVPASIRHTLNLESGLNDGMALPFVLFFIILASPGGDAGTEAAKLLGEAAFGALVGIVLGAMP